MDIQKVRCRDSRSNRIKNLKICGEKAAADYDIDEFAKMVSDENL